MNNQRSQSIEQDQWPQLTIELINRCNLHCGYCLRDDDALHHARAQFLPLELLRGVIVGARDEGGVKYVSFTGGEPTLHPQFAEVMALVASEGLQCGFVTNGWNFERICPVLLANRTAVRVVAFSLDGATAEAHDRWRGAGSFVRVMRAITRCYVHRLPFIIKVGLRRDTVPQLEQIALLAARLGAAALHFSHLLPTSASIDAELALNADERAVAEQEVGVLAKILKMPVGVSIGHFDLDPAPPCPPLGGMSANVDYRGRLTLCCNLSGFRGTGANNDAESNDVIADLTREEFATAYARLRRVAESQTARRRVALAAMATDGKVDPFVASPCLFCLQSFDKLPWRAGGNATARSLPILYAQASTK